MFFCSVFDSVESIQKVSELKCSREIMVPAEVVAVVVAVEEAEAAITAAQER
jgi:flagellar hook-basal body complex protein FliE